MPLNEFELIKNYFTREPKRADVLLGIGDDGAILTPNALNQWVWTTDTLNDGVHFFSDDPPHAIGYKAMAVNLSDLAAMGATPAWASLSLCLPEFNADWLSQFSAGIFELIDKYNIDLVGGDTTRGPLSICVSLIGHVKPDQALRRDGAKVGDGIYLGKSIGDAGLVLRQRQKSSPDVTLKAENMRPLHYPVPQIELGLALAGRASSAIDISDGFAQDLGHILKRSGKGAIIHLDQIPLSDYARGYIEATQDWAQILNAGDDYVLCFTMQDQNLACLENNFSEHLIYRIGEITAGAGISWLQHHNEIELRNIDGFKHF